VNLFVLGATGGTGSEVVGPMACHRRIMQDRRSKSFACPAYSAATGHRSRPSEEDLDRQGLQSLRREPIVISSGGLLSILIPHLRQYPSGQNGRAARDSIFGGADASGVRQRDICTLDVYSCFVASIPFFFSKE
jgi:hypothetical protein